MPALLVRLLPLVAAIASTGCLTSASASKTFRAGAPSPVETAPERLQLARGPILVVTPKSFEPPRADVGSEEEGPPARGFRDAPDWDAAVTSAERALLKLGWKPANVQVDPSDAQPASRSSAKALVERAVRAAAKSGVEHVLVLRELRYGFGPELVPSFRPSDLCPWRGLVAVDVMTDAVLLDKTGQVLWTGRGSVDATHLMPPGEHRVDYAFDADKRACTFALNEPLRDEHLAGRTCMTTDLKDPGEPPRVLCEQGYRAPVPPELIEASVRRVVEALDASTR